MQFDQAMTVVPPPPQRFTLDEWHLNNRYRFRCSEAQQQLADRLLAESDRIRELTTENAKANKAEVDHRLEEKLKDIEFRKEELLRIRKEVLLECDALLVYKERLMDALSSVKRNALVICQKCLIARLVHSMHTTIPHFIGIIEANQFQTRVFFIASREHRLGIDLVHDDVERELRKECEVIGGAENLLVRTLEQAHEQIRRLKATMYNMDHDLEDKENNLRIDRHNLTLKETSLNLSLYHGNARLDPSYVYIVYRNVTKVYNSCTTNFMFLT